MDGYLKIYKTLICVERKTPEGVGFMFPLNSPKGMNNKLSHVPYRYVITRTILDPRHYAWVIKLSRASRSGEKLFKYIYS